LIAVAAAVSAAQFARSLSVLIAVATVADKSLFEFVKKGAEVYAKA
jgi:hypothetical protein